MPATRMAKFEVFIGTWNTTGEVLATESDPAGILSATDVYRWLPGRHFVIHDVDSRFDVQRKRLAGLWELKGSKAGWQPWIELELVRA